MAPKGIGDSDLGNHHFWGGSMLNLEWPRVFFGKTCRSSLLLGMISRVNKNIISHTSCLVFKEDWEEDYTPENYL